MCLRSSASSVTGFGSIRMRYNFFFFSKLPVISSYEDKVMIPRGIRWRVLLFLFIYYFTAARTRAAVNV